MKPTVFIALQVIIDQGGISTSIQNLLNEIHDKYDITLCSVGDYISPNAHIPSNVVIIKGSSLIRDALINRSFLKTQSLYHRLRRNGRRLIRRLLGMPFIVKRGIRLIPVPDVEYDVAIAFSNDIYSNGKLSVGGVYDFILSCVKAKRKVAWMHNDLRREGYTSELILNVFRDFDSIVSVSEENKLLLDGIAPEFKSKSFVVYNTYNLECIKKLATMDSPYKNNGKLHFVTVARIYLPQKRQDRIVKVCERLKKEGYSNFDWYLVGGGDVKLIKQLIKEYDVEDIIYCEGLKTNPYPYMYYADAFVLTSQYEGYGMTLKEAQILACPTLVTNFGPAHEAVEHNSQGIICENSTEGVFSMMQYVLEHPDILTAYRDYLNEHPISNNLAIRQFNSVCGFD